MELDTKQTVLLAIYAEYQRDEPDMRAVVNAEALGMEHHVFCVAVEKLLNECLITGAKIHRALGGRMSVTMDFTMMTPRGIDYVQEKLSIPQVHSGREKVELVIKKATEFGWEQVKDFGAKVLAEIINKRIDG